MVNFRIVPSPTGGISTTNRFQHDYCGRKWNVPHSWRCSAYVIEPLALIAHSKLVNADLARYRAMDIPYYTPNFLCFLLTQEVPRLIGTSQILAYHWMHLADSETRAP